MIPDFLRLPRSELQASPGRTATDSQGSYINKASAGRARRRGLKDHVDMRILNSGSKAQYEGDVKGSGPPAEIVISAP